MKKNRQPISTWMVRYIIIVLLLSISFIWNTAETSEAQTAPSCASVQVTREQTTGFTLQVQGVKSAVAIRSVRVAVWSMEQQKNIYWYTAKRSGTDYSIDVNFANHRYAAGTYMCHAYLTDTQGTVSYLGGKSVNEKIAASNYTTEVSGDEKQISVTVAGITHSDLLSELRIAVWSENNGQDDLRWYTATKTSAGYQVQIPVKNHKTTGFYQLHAYGWDRAGQANYLKAAKQQIHAPSARVSSDITKLSSGLVSIQLTNISVPSGTDKINIYSWQGEKQTILKSSQAVKQKDGSYLAQFSIADFQYQTGVYHSHAYVTDGNGFTTFVGGVNTEVKRSSGTLRAGTSSDEQKITISLTGMQEFGNEKEVRFAVWSIDGGQNDLQWIKATKNQSGYEATEAVNRHGSTGTYAVHAYLEQKDGKLSYLAAATCAISSPSGKLEATNRADGATEVTVREVKSASGIKQLRIAAWTMANQSDLYWYTGALQSDGSYAVTIDLARHAYHTGIYTIRAYLVTQNGITAYIGGVQRSISLYYGDYYVENPSANLETYGIRLENTSSYLKSVQFGVWSEKNGQDDFFWYEGKKDSKKNNYSGEIVIRNHLQYGIYHVHAYGILGNGEKRFLGGTDFTVSSLPDNLITFSDENIGSFTADVSIREEDYTITSVRYAVWMDENQDDLYWYQTTKSNEKDYSASVFAGYHKYHYGLYKVHVYAIDNSGNYHYVTGSTKTMTAPGSVQVTSCQASADGTVTVTANASGNGTQEYGLFYIGINDTMLKDGQAPVAAVRADSKISLRAAINRDTSESLLQRKLVLALKTGGRYLIVTNGNYINNPEVLARYTYAFPTAASKKGLQINTGMMSDVAELGVKHTVINLPLNSIISESPTDTAYMYHGKVYYFQTGYMNYIDQQTAQLAAQGAVTTGVILLQSSTELLHLIIPSGRAGGHLFYGLNTQEDSAVEELGATFTYLAMRYADASHRVVNWVLGNELDDPEQYYWCGDVSFDTYVTYYAEAFRLLSNCVKSVYSQARIYTSLDQCWTYVRSGCYSGKSFLTAFANQMSQQNIAWNLAFHPYPSPLTNASFWGNNALVADNWDSPVITMKNLYSLTDYLKYIYGSNVRVILSETGFTSVSNGVQNEQLQAAAIAYAYYLAEFNDMVDSFVVHRHVDHQVEMAQGLYLGLWANENGQTESPTRKKPAWTIFKYMDTSQSLQYTNFALSVIGAQSWQSIVPGFNPGRF